MLIAIFIAALNTAGMVALLLDVPAVAVIGSYVLASVAALNVGRWSRALG